MCFNDYDDDNEYYKYYNAYDDGQDQEPKVVYSNHSNNDDYEPSSVGPVVPANGTVMLIIIGIIWYFYAIYHNCISLDFSLKTILVCAFYSGISFMFGKWSKTGGGFLKFISFLHIFTLSITGINALSTLDGFNLLTLLFVLTPIVLFFIGHEHNLEE